MAHLERDRAVHVRSRIQRQNHEYPVARRFRRRGMRSCPSRGGRLMVFPGTSRISIPSVVLIGGGRWARVHATVLRQILSNDTRIFWVTRHNRADVLRSLTTKADQPTVTEVFDKLDEALRMRP